ncbi:hypothetical protein V6N12_060232 [Hibiscus sabdariffa]|uniref:Uncharacterized protein n=1 Tax=Hibiscus sabdariffa TaxID=183260 RepID=A0ABR2D3U7_9ROSI
MYKGVNVPDATGLSSLLERERKRSFPSSRNHIRREHKAYRQTFESSLIPTASTLITNRQHRYIEAQLPLPFYFPNQVSTTNAPKSGPKIMWPWGDGLPPSTSIADMMGKVKVGNDE